ncbi:MAG: class I mannose-6-phosphate isomerase [Treponema sp.]|nr:class I mannose-6-phosphate isomerase [Treponema sp.]
MIKLTPVRSEKVWGYEDWIASTHPDGAQKEFIELVKDYPLLVKIIQANDTLSVQVHPDDKTAVKLEGPDAVGKTECWFVLDAAPDARLISGLNDNYSKEQMADAIAQGRTESLLNSISVKKGDFIFIPAGTVHAIGGGLRLLEVQQNCNITYRLYDWGRPREIHVEKALTSIVESGKNVKTKTSVEPLTDFSCEYFELHKKDVKGGYSYINTDKNRVQLLYIISGSPVLHALNQKGQKTAKSTSVIAKPEEIYAVPYGEKITVEGTASVIRIIPRQ